MVIQNQWLERTTDQLALILNQEHYAVSYRWLSAHLVHSNGIHLALNLIAFVVIYALFFQILGRHFFGMLVACALTISGLYLLSSHQYDTYVGLSGCLHGLLIGGAIQQYRKKQHRTSNAVIIFGVTVKLAHEQYFGPNPKTEAWINAAVATDAHLYGAVGAIGYIIIWAVYENCNHTSTAR